MAASLGSWLGATVSTVVKPLYDPLVKHATYVFTSGRNVGELVRGIETLRAIRGDVERQIEDGRRQNRRIATAEADCWLATSQHAISDGDAISERYELRRVIFGCCSPNCWLNYKISKKANRTLRIVNNCVSSRPTNLTVQPPPPSVMHMPVKLVQSKLLPSQKQTLEDALHRIANDPAGIIGIWGPGGVGKTLLLKTINNSFDRIDSPFDIVIYLTASRECAVQNMQSDILRRLNMQDDDSITQATRIYGLLKEKSFLVLVDDLYEKMDLAAVGVPFPLGFQGQLKRKVVITTRSKTLCDVMDVNEYIEISGLDINEAMQLFKERVGDESIYSQSPVGAPATVLVEELGGRPSELKNVGKAMRGKKDVKQWEDAIRIFKTLNRNKDDPLSATEQDVRKLDAATKTLHARRKDVLHQIEIAKKNGKVATNLINTWLTQVETTISEGSAICDKYKLNCDVRAIVAENLIKIQECLNNQPTHISVEALPPSVQKMPRQSKELQPSRAAMLQEAVRYIMYDPEGVIGIWGLGGAGKTHLLKEINNDFLEQSFFDYVIFVTASKDTSVENIQFQIVEKLSLPHVHNIESQARSIFQFLEEKNFMILLDDVWEQIDLQAVGIPYPLGLTEQHKRKVVLTTRSNTVCGQMLVRRELKVACLQDDEAWELFRENVDKETISSSPRIEALARELVKELKGLPLALITIGRAMYKKTIPEEWNHAIAEMKKSYRGKDNLLSMDYVFKQLKFSYDSLRTDALKNCFLTCSLWPEDYQISKNELIQCWMGLGLVDEDDIHSSYRKVHGLIGELTAACLLETCESSYHEMPLDACVKMHDVVRDTAIWISRGCDETNDKWIVHSGVLKNSFRIAIPWSNAECVSLMHNRMIKLPPIDHMPGSISLKALYLQHNSLNELVDIKIFTALKYLDLSFNCLNNIPACLCSLANLEFLDLSHNEEIDEVPVCLGELDKLKFLYLGDTSIGKVPEGVISSLQALQVLDIRTNMEFGYTSIFRELSNLKNLKAVDANIHRYSEYILLSPATEVPIRFLGLYDLRKTSRSRLQYDFDTSSDGSAFRLSSGIFSYGSVRNTLYELNIGSSCIEQISIERGESESSFATLSRLSLEDLGLEEVIWKGISPQDMFPMLTHLNIDSCKKLQHVSWAMYLPVLEDLQVSLCYDMKQAFPQLDGKASSRSTFPCLKSLLMKQNYEMVSLCDSDVTFPSLEKLSVTFCPKLKRLMQSLPKELKELTLWGSDSPIILLDKLEWEKEDVKCFFQARLPQHGYYMLASYPKAKDGKHLDASTVHQLSTYAQCSMHGQRSDNEAEN